MRKSIFYSLNKILLYLAIFFAIFMPADSLNIKKGLFFIVILMNTPIIYYDIKEWKFPCICFYAMIYPLMLFMFSFISGGYLQESISNTYFWGYLFFIFIIDRYKYDYEKMLINVLLALALFILFLVGADFWGLIDVNTHYIPDVYKRQENVTVRVLPSLLTLADGQVSVSRLRSVNLEDLLRLSLIHIFFGNIRMRKKEASSIRSATAQSGVSPRASTAESGIPAPQMNATKTSAMSAISTDR